MLVVIYYIWTTWMVVERFAVSCNILHRNMSRSMFHICDCRNFKMLFLWCNWSQSHIFASLLLTYGLRFPLSISDPIYPTNLLFWFPWDRTPIPHKWTSSYWTVQFTCQDSGVIIVTLFPMTSIVQLKCYWIVLSALILDHA